MPRARAGVTDVTQEAEMKFGTDDETAGAMLVVVRHLQPLVQRIEDGVTGMGLSIDDKWVTKSTTGTANAILRISAPGRQSDGWKIELNLRNAIDEFLTIDRDEDPARLDLRLFDEGYAEKKLAGIVAGRLAILRAVADSRDSAEAKQKVERLAPQFEQIRIWQVEGEEKKGRRRLWGSL